MLEEAEKLPIEYDEDCPKLTPEQLAQFRPVNYDSMDERAQAMKQEAELLAGFRQLGPSVIYIKKLDLLFPLCYN